MTPYTASTGEYFRTLKALENVVRRVLHAGERELFGDDYKLILWLFDKHPRRAEKADTERPRMRVARSTWENDQFQVQHSDGRWIAWSYRSAMHGLTRGSNGYALSEFTKGCRVAVRGETLGAKRVAFGDALTATCAVSGQSISWEDAHVDHAPPWEFARIVSEFLRESQIDLESFRVVEGRLPDDIAARFATYHNARAILRVVHKDVNCGLLRRRG